ncbi:hypothetical protein CSAL01_05441 [Colletotrichum salicis]|uniref:Uncharacterized protein n=1 Tax=Colletotrichum salicis TaxID=1209931 RepID=A0A135UHH5_9PEZI|nr:hypothetical protein CSAL01_05441 [Colletotrichum salicis]
MPSLSLLRRGSKQHDQRPLSPSKRQQRQQEVRPPLSPPQENGREASAGGLGIGTGEPERERKFSKRDLFGGLLSRSKGRSTSSSASTPASSTKSGRGPGAESSTKLPITRASSFYFPPRLWYFPLPVLFSDKVPEMDASSLDQLQRPEVPISPISPVPKAGDEKVAQNSSKAVLGRYTQRSSAAWIQTCCA